MRIRQVLERQVAQIWKQKRIKYRSWFGSNKIDVKRYRSAYLQKTRTNSADKLHTIDALFGVQLCSQRARYKSKQ